MFFTKLTKKKKKKKKKNTDYFYFLFYFGIEITFLSCNNCPEMQLLCGPLKYYCEPPVCYFVSVDPLVISYGPLRSTRGENH